MLWAFHGDTDDGAGNTRSTCAAAPSNKSPSHKLAGPGDEVITKMASLLVELAQAHPPRLSTSCAITDPDAALALLTEGDKLVETDDERGRTKARNAATTTRLRPHSPFDDLEPIDPAEALGDHRED